MYDETESEKFIIAAIYRLSVLFVSLVLGVFYPSGAFSPNWI